MSRSFCVSKLSSHFQEISFRVYITSPFLNRRLLSKAFPGHGRWVVSLIEDSLQSKVIFNIGFILFTERVSMWGFEVCKYWGSAVMLDLSPLILQNSVLELLLWDTEAITEIILTFFHCHVIKECYLTYMKLTSTCISASLLFSYTAILWDPLPRLSLRTHMLGAPSVTIWQMRCIEIQNPNPSR